MMKAIISVNLTVLVLIVSSVYADALERGPVAVSPGSDARIARVGMSCPTFSWSGVEWAVGYKVVVFETNGPNVLAYKEMEAIANPVLIRKIEGRALSWTPSSDERLSNGDMYVWYVRAEDAYGTGIWSEGSMFKVEVEARLVGMEEMVRKSLKENGVSNEVIDDVLRDMESGVKEVVVWGVDAEGRVNKTQDKIGIQGFEGASNTFYGTGAGGSITTGSYNTFIGRLSGGSDTSGHYNTFMGSHSGYSNTTGQYNTFIGISAGYANNANNNTIIGHQAGYTNWTGSDNTFIGVNAGFECYSGSYNTIIGSHAGYTNSVGGGNTFIGYGAGYSNTATANTFIGNNAGIYNTTGQWNTFLGYNAGYNNTTGQSNVFLGYNAGFYETGSNRLYIDNSGTSSPLIYGEFDNDIVAVNGKLGVGTKSPGYPMHLQKTGANAAFIADRTDGAINYINATSSYGNFGTVNNYPLRMVVNAVWRMRLDSDNSLTMANGATCSAGGVWTDASSRDLKENIHSLTSEEAIDALRELNPVKYNYKTDKEEDCVGFIAENVPDLVASKDRKGMSPMDVVAVLTKVVQEQQKLSERQQKTIDELQKKIDELERKSK